MKCTIHCPAAKRLEVKTKTSCKFILGEIFCLRHNKKWKVGKECIDWKKEKTGNKQKEETNGMHKELPGSSPDKNQERRA